MANTGTSITKRRCPDSSTLNVETSVTHVLYDEPRTPHVFYVQRDVLDRGDDLVLVGGSGRITDEQTSYAPRSGDLSFATTGLDDDEYGASSYPRDRTPTMDRPILRQGSGSFINQRQIVIESDCEPEEADFDQLKAWLNRYRKLIYTPALDEQIQPSPIPPPEYYDSPEDFDSDPGCDSDASNTTENANLGVHSISRESLPVHQLHAPKPAPSHIAFSYDDVDHAESYHDLNGLPTPSASPEINSSHFCQTEMNFFNLQPSYDSSAGTRRSIVFRAVEEMFSDSLPRHRKPLWMELQHSMKIYPVTIHYAIQALKYLATINLPLPYITRTFNGIDHESFLRHTKEWATWTVLEAIARHDQIKSSLIEVLTHVEMLVAYANGIPLARVWSQLLRECLMYDHDDMKQVIDTILVLGDKAIDSAMRLTAGERNTIMNVLQTLVDGQVTNHRLCEKFLQKLVRRSGELPGYLVIQDVEKLGSNPVGGGGFSDVWKGSLRSTLVAMKVLRLFNLTEKERNRIQMDYCTESMLWRQLKHRNVLPFLGVSVDEFSPRLAMISPWLEKGCVTRYLKDNPLADRRQMITGIAMGLRYLHTLKPLVVHGDLRGANVLIDDDGQPRLADFGLAHFLDSQASCAGPSFRGGGTLRWQAPELLASNNFNGISNPCQVTTCTDVYAFAVLCWEIFTLDVPYSGLRDGDVVLRVVRRERPPRPPDHAGRLGLSDRLWKLIESCWDHYPQRRPNMDIVVEKLTAGTKTSYEHANQLSMLDIQKVDVFHIPDTTVILPSIDSVLSSRRSTLSRASSTTLSPISMGSPWWNDSEW